MKKMAKENPLEMDMEIWNSAEKRIDEILSMVSPSGLSDKRRIAIVQHLQGLIKHNFGCEVFPFGSVPLKAYLPDGDIDLTIISQPTRVKDLIKDICMILEAEQHDTEFPVYDVKYVGAQVEIVKCTINDIAVDISFNQITGLSSLCFLEQVDEYIGGDHLFKRSVILIKAWCYYESRTLGAYYSLLSTYALETMVLYIISCFHSSLPGPLAVLYKFLDYYSQFDWDNYCVSINGPVAICSLPKIVAAPENETDGLLLTEEFIHTCREKFTNPTINLETKVQEFTIKHLNVVDPLQDSNNLGRSICKGSFYRIRCAFTHGMKKLQEILMQPGESLGEGLEKFFAKTLERNGRGIRPDVQIAVSAYGTGRTEVSDLNGDLDNYYNYFLYSQMCHQTSPTLQPSCSPSPSQVRTGRMITRPICDQNPFSCRGTAFYVPRVHFNTSQPSTSPRGYQEMGRSRGTGTYIPDVTNLSFKEMRSSPRSRSRATGTHGTMPDHTRSSRIEISSENGTNKVLNLSVKESPLLPDQRINNLVEPNLCSLPTTQLSQLKQPSDFLEKVQFGSFRQISQDELSALLSDNLGSSRDLMALASTASGASNRRQKENEQQNSTARWFRPYQLEDSKDFPTLQ